METESFSENLSCDEPAAVARVMSFLEPWLRRVIHVRLHGSRLRRIADTGDVFQSLVKDLMSQAAGLRCVADCPSSLKQYLIGAIQNKIKSRLRKERRNAGGLDGYPEPVSAEPDAARAVTELDFVQTVESRLSAENRRLLEFRRNGCTWEEVAQTVGGQPDALRMRLRRALAVAILELGK